MKHLFIVNPVAGGRDMTDSIAILAEKSLGTSSDDVEIYTTCAPMDACSKVKAAALDYGGELRVYACGGDGTLNECVNGAAGFGHIAVTHFPCGTGNDFIKTFDKDQRAFFELNRLVSGNIRDLDLIKVNGRYSINISSVGIDARIGGEVHNYSKMLKGKAAYLISAVVNIMRGINMELSVKCGEYSHHGSYSLICACNGRFYGGMFNPMPDAQPDDGIIEFLIVRKMTRMEFIRNVNAYAKGRYKELPQYITHLRGAKLEIESDSELTVNVDGELIFAKHLTFELVPRGLRFIFPC